MILIGLGANQIGPWGDALQTLNTAIESLRQVGLRVEKQSYFVISSPMGRPNQPDYVNGAAILRTHLPPDALLKRLHALEKMAGRRRGARWGARSLDLDLLDWHGIICNWPEYPPISGHAGKPGYQPLTLPHPGMAYRPFVLAPVAEIAPRWRHPVLHKTAAQLLRELKSSRGGRILRRI